MTGFGMSLFPQHQEILISSAISPMIARERGYVSVDTKKRLDDLGFKSFQQIVPGLLIPIHTVDQTKSYQYRPDNPRLQSGQTVKYESLDKNRLDVHPSMHHTLTDPTWDLCVTEGIKKADALMSIGLPCIGLNGVFGWTQKGNEEGQRVPHADWSYVTLKGRKIFIVFDNDVHTNPDIMRELRTFTKFLRKSKADVSVMLLPRCEEKIGIDDYLFSGGKVEDLECADPWVTCMSPPVPKRSFGVQSLRFPIEAYPTQVRSFIDQVVADSGAPGNYLGAGVLPVLGTALGATAVLNAGGTWLERPCIWLALLGKPGINKTPAFKPLVSPLQKLHFEYAKYNEKAIADYYSIAKNQRDETPIPQLKAQLIEDATIEALSGVLKDNPDGVMMYDDELKGWLVGMDKYSGGGRGERQRWLKIFSATTIIINRKGRGDIPISINIRNPFVSVFGGVQPKILPSFSHSDDGFAPRFLFSVGEHDGLMHHPPEKGQLPAQYDEWEQVVRRMKKIGKVTAQLSDEADRPWRDWYAKNGPRKLKDETMGLIYSKMEAYFLRFCIILHCLDAACEGEKLGEVSLDQFERAHLLVDWFENQAEIIARLDDASTDRDQQYEMQLIKLRQWIIDHPWCSFRDAQGSGPSFARNGKVLTEMLRDLDLSL